MKIALEDPAIQVAVVWLQLMHAYADALIEVFKELKRSVQKPFVVCWLAAPEAALHKLRDVGIYAIGATERTIDVVAGLLSHRKARERLLATPRPNTFTPPSTDTGTAQPVPSMAARDMLADAGIPLVHAELAANANEAAAAAERLGLPVAVKIESPDILHKADAGGVRLGLASAEEVRAAADEIIAAASEHRADARIDGVLVQPMAVSGTELVVGLRQDSMFGPIVMLGLGGVFVEALKDVAFARAPLLRDDVLLMIDSLQGKTVLEGVRGQPAVNTEALTDTSSRSRNWR